MKIVVGLDPGITTGIAICDLSGEIKEVFSRKGMSKPEIVRFILSRGSPLVIACDKKVPPKLISEIASALAIPVFSPKEDLKIKEKTELLKQLGIKPKNAHERDAIAAVIYFFKKHSRKFREIDNILEAMGLEQHSEKVKELLIKKRASNLSEALEKILGESVDIEKIKKQKSSKKEKKLAKEEKIKILERRYQIAQEYIKKLEKRVKELEEQKKMLLEERLKESREIREAVMKDKEIELRENIIKNLRTELQKEREMRKKLEEKLELLEEERIIEAKGLVPAIKVSEFSKEAIMLLKEKFRIFNKVLVFQTPCRGKSTAKYLASLRPRIAIGNFGEEEKSVLESSGIEIVEKEQALKNAEEFKHFYGISPEKLSEVLKKERKKSFLEWLERYRKRFL